MKLEKWKEAKEVLRETLIRAPGMQEIYSSLQVINENLGNMQDAISNFKSYEMLKKSKSNPQEKSIGALKSLLGKGN